MTSFISPTGNATGRALVSANNLSLCIRVSKSPPTDELYAHAIPKKLSPSIFISSLLYIHANATSVLRSRPSAWPYHTAQVTSNTQDSKTLHAGKLRATGEEDKEIRSRRVPSPSCTNA